MYNSHMIGARTFVVLFLVLSAVPSHAVDLGLIDAYQKKDARALAKHAARHAGGPLEPYFIARMADEKGLAEGRAAPDLSKALDRFQGVPPIEELRGTLLKAWVKKGEWPQVGRHIGHVPDWLYDRDMELRCVRIAFQKQRQHTFTETPADLFDRLTEFPPSCAVAFSGAVTAGELTAEQAMAKLMHLSVLGKTGDAGRLAAAVGQCLRGARANAVMDILTTARKDYRDGLREYEKLSRHLDSETARDVLVYIGVAAARSLAADAHRIIKSAEGYSRALSPAAAEWRTKAALMAGSWEDVAASIESAPLSQRNEPFSKYWRARALERTGHEEASAKIYEQLAQHPGYYGILAAERLRVPPPYLSLARTVDYRIPPQLSANTAVKRALALHAAGLWVEAALELNILMRGADSAAFYTAALFAKDSGIIDRQISFAQRAAEHIDLPLRYPVKYRREVAEASSAAGLPPELVWAVIRQESRFVPHAVSRAGAIGLMQVMPATAQHLLKAKGAAGMISRAELMRPERNILLGTSFLRAMMQRYEGNYAYAAAAYNAGPGRVDRWQVQFSGLDMERFIELIPFTETRDYTKQVLANYVFYSYVTDGKPVSLSGLSSKIVLPRTARAYHE